MPRAASAIPEVLQPFAFHGISFTQQDSRGECHADHCPACGGSKFSVNIDSGLYSCYSSGCAFFVEGGGEAGGSTKFLRWLHEVSNAATTQYDDYAADRGLLFPETLMYWGACQSVLTGEWLFPAHNPDIALTQVYKRIKTPDRWEWRPTPKTGGHAMHLQCYDGSAESIWVCEGPGDAMALWESLRIAKPGDRQFEFTGNPSASLLDNGCVIAVPNCGAVGEPMRRYLPLFAGKRVILCFDHDTAGRDATKRAAGMLGGVARELLYIKWPENSKDGWDVRDALRGAK